jgi:hypothetical protein
MEEKDSNPTACPHTNTQDYLSFDNFESQENIRGIYTFCLDCQTKLIN